jgi:hypothetical protein
MSEDKQKRKNEEGGEVEWSFDFADLSNSVKGMFDSLAGEVEIQHSNFAVARSGIENARIKLSFAAGKNNLVALDATSPNVFEATLKHVGEIEFTEEGDVTKTIHLKHKSRIKELATPIREGFRAMANADELEWDVKVATGIPLSFDINGGVGPTKLDMTGLNVRSLKMAAGVGTLHLTLPEQKDQIEAKIHTGVGQVKIVVPDSSDVNLDINAGVGEVIVVIPPNAAVQLRATTGIGSVNVPRSLKRHTKKDFMEQGGMWQSDGFDLASRRIVIRYNGGVGAFNLKEGE